jgi:RNA polymerase sigma factor (sigma-70 family)
MGGGRDRFPETRLSLVQAARNGDGGTRRRALDALIAGYWKPVYTYLRLKWRLSNEDAKDLTQGFFTGAVAGSFFDRYDPSKAKFRTYLRLCLDGYVSNERKAARRIKRGGDASHISLDFETAEGELAHIDIPDDSDPEAIFRQEWIRSVLAAAVEELRERCRARGWPDRFEVFERYDLDPTPERVSYADIATALDLPVTQVTNHLAWARREFRAIVLERLRELAGSEDEYRDDVRDLLGTDTQ